MPPYQIPYASRGTSIAELIQLAGQQEAEGIRRGGQIWGNTISGLGELAGNTIRDIAEGKRQRKAAEAKMAAEAPRIAQETRKRELDIRGQEQQIAKAEREMGETQMLSELFSGEQPPTPAQLIQVVGPERGIALSRGLDALRPDKQSQYKDGMGILRDAILGVAAVPEPMKPQAYAMARTNLLQRGLIDESMAPAEYTPEGFAQIMNFGKEQAAPKQAESFTLSPGQVRYGADGKPVASVPNAPKEPKDRMWVMRPDANGKLQPVRVSESEIRPGDQPASTKEQGRPVISGDANDIAGIQESLKLAEGLKSGQFDTGARAWLTSNAPDFVTELTGIGASSKATQGMINIVKQIIGKGLEGGVLRLEDEKKYAKIIPQISDPAEVVSAKLANLQSALRDKQSFKLNALEDAGYDVSKYRDRLGSAPSASTGKRLTATNPQTGERVESLDGGQTWRPLK